MNIPQIGGWDIVDHDPMHNTTTLHKYDESEDQTIIRTVHHNTKKLLEQNKQACNNYDHHLERKSDFRNVASIPTEVQMIWLTKFGVDIFKKDHWHKVKQLLNDPEWAYLKRTPLVI